jgi:hypothetical protein
MRPARGSRLSLRQFRARPASSRRLHVELLEPRCYLALLVPAFSSLPGANQTIYLDFDGHVTQNTAWNRLWKDPLINSPAYDIDGNTTSFNPQELATIESAWKRVAEDFIPFQVNVTTVDPGVEALRRSGWGDTQWGVRVVITADTERTGTGGISYVGSFTWNTDTPSFVYVRGEKPVAEAASHEAGHSLGLAHDGTASSEYYHGHGSGEISWAPIMGVGYYSNVTTWSRGEYRSANNDTGSANYGRGPDDLAIITSWNGFGYRADDYGNDLGSASPLTGPSVNLAGIIGTTTDVDVFRLQAGRGTASFTVRPFTPGPNLDVKAELLNSQWVAVATADPPTSLTASLSFTIPAAGTYYLRISGVGAGNPLAPSPTGYTDYGSLGRYTLTGFYAVGTAPGGPQPRPPHFPEQSMSSGGTVVVSWDGRGTPPNPVMDAWTDFVSPDDDFPLPHGAGSGAVDVPATVMAALATDRVSGSVGIARLELGLASSGDGALRLAVQGKQRRNELVISLPTTARSSPSESDEVFADDNADWTAPQSSSARSTGNRAVQLTTWRAQLGR